MTQLGRATSVSQQRALPADELGVSRVLARAGPSCDELQAEDGQRRPELMTEKPHQRAPGARVHVIQLPGA